MPKKHKKKKKPQKKKLQENNTPEYSFYKPAEALAYSGLTEALTEIERLEREQKTGPSDTLLNTVNTYLNELKNENFDNLGYALVIYANALMETQAGKYTGKISRLDKILWSSVRYCS